MRVRFRESAAFYVGEVAQVVHPGDVVDVDPRQGEQMVRAGTAERADAPGIRRRRRAPEFSVLPRAPEKAVTR